MQGKKGDIKQMKQRYLITIIFLSTVLILAIIFGCFWYFSTSPSENIDNEEVSDEEVLFVKRDKPFKILQFADLHFGVEGTAFHNSDIERSLNFIDDAILRENPDFIVLLGDNMMSQGIEGARFIVETFDKYQIPYTYVFGNHDAELYDVGYSKSEVSAYLENCDSQYLLYKSGYTQTDSENRYGNFSISIRDEITNNLLGAFVIIDTGVYDYSKAQYQSINEGQITWYNQEIERLNGIYQKQTSNVFDTIPTITYGHIQLPEYVDAYQKAKNNDGAEFVYEQELPNWITNGVTNDVANCSFFEAMKNMRSAKAYFCGHMHGLTLHVKMDGIILGFCPQACVTGNPSKIISTFSYTVNTDFEISPKLVVESINKETD